MKERIILSSEALRKYMQEFLELNQLDKMVAVRIYQSVFSFGGTTKRILEGHSRNRSEFTGEITVRQFNNLYKILNIISDQPITLAIEDKGWIEVNPIII